jgi:hypothetical protein
MGEGKGVKRKLFCPVCKAELIKYKDPRFAMNDHLFCTSCERFYSINQSPRVSESTGKYRSGLAKWLQGDHPTGGLGIDYDENNENE